MFPCWLRTFGAAVKVVAGFAGATASESRSGESAQKKLLDTKSKPKIDLAALTCVAFY